MTTAETIPRTYDEAVRLLAHWHGEGDEPPVTIYSCDDPGQRVVRLVEVSEGFPATGEMWPVVFGRSEEFPFKSAVVLVTPGEWAQIRSGRLALPDGWDAADMTRVWPE